MKKSKLEKYVMCDCGAHLIEIEKDDETDEMWYLTLWSADGYNHMIWRMLKRFKYAWKMLRWGRVDYADIILRKEGRDKLIKLLED